MWMLQPGVLPTDLCRTLIDEADRQGLVRFEERHFVSGGKTFFGSRGGLGRLKRVMQAVAARTSILDRFRVPVIEHAYLLIKSASGPATPVHQDRAFWTKKETTEPASMLTLWFAMEPIPADRGALRLTRHGRTDDATRLNGEPRLYHHIQTEFSGSGNFGLVIDGPEAEIIETELETVCPEAGDLVVFDAYEPHGSMPHQGEGARMAFKVVLGERDRLSAWLVPVDDLLRQPTVVTYARLKGNRLFA